MQLKPVGPEPATSTDFVKPKICIERHRTRTSNFPSLYKLQHIRRALIMTWPGFWALDQNETALFLIHGDQQIACLMPFQEIPSFSEK